MSPLRKLLISLAALLAGSAFLCATNTLVASSPVSFSEPEVGNAAPRDQPSFEANEAANVRAWQERTNLVESLIKRLAANRARAMDADAPGSALRPLYGLEFPAVNPQPVGYYDFGVLKRAARSRHCLFNAVDCID